MQKAYWFKAKTYGWGWTPSAWQGWVVVAIFVAFVEAGALTSLFAIRGVGGWVGFAATLIVACAALTIVCYKTGEKPAWRWGGKQ